MFWLFLYSRRIYRCTAGTLFWQCESIKNLKKTRVMVRCIIDVPLCDVAYSSFVTGPHYSLLWLLVLPSTVGFVSSVMITFCEIGQGSFHDPFSLTRWSSEMQGKHSLQRWLRWRKIHGQAIYEYARTLQLMGPYALSYYCHRHSVWTCSDLRILQCIYTWELFHHFFFWMYHFDSMEGLELHK